MKANEFIKKYGVEEARHQSSLLQEIQINNNHQEYIDDLKRLIESHELVEKMGGIECLKDMALYGVTQEKFRDQLKQAIADVEICQ